jgi:thiol-disulfide isomerase/thioredoxin
MLLAVSSAWSQSQIQGKFAPFAGNTVYLIAYEGFGEILLDSTRIAPDGSFVLNYEQSKGLGYVFIDESNSCLVVLEDPEIQLSGMDLADSKNFKVLSGEQTKILVQFFAEQAARNQVLNGWFYMRNLYKNEKHLNNAAVLKSIDQEIDRLKLLEQQFFKNAEKYPYVHEFIQIKSLILSVLPTLEYRKEEIPALVKAFRALNYNSDVLWRSGALSDAIQAHFYLIDTKGGLSYEIFEEHQISVDILINNLAHNSERFNPISNHLFIWFEQRNLFHVSEYMAFKILELDNCSIESEFGDKLEFYRKLKPGNPIPPLKPTADVYLNGSFHAKSFDINQVKSKYKILIFGSSWCPKCAEELIEINEHYAMWKQMGAEVIFVSLDTESDKFKAFAQTIPGYSICDFLKWDSPIIKDFHVFSTPTIFLVDTQNTVLLRPFSVFQLHSWLLINAKK